MTPRVNCACANFARLRVIITCLEADFSIFLFSFWTDSWGHTKACGFVCNSSVFSMVFELSS
ncbi:unnamed protein product [Meloidogyne enterolobii]|uniref:Uncharacterized protein n=1 Tax=Meloidogyne enterolobii TaxID=390850 RepID=A0ACB0ZKB0_MELEN